MAGKEALRWLTLTAEIEETLTVVDNLLREGKEAMSIT